MKVSMYEYPVDAIILQIESFWKVFKMYHVPGGIYPKVEKILF